MKTHKNTLRTFTLRNPRNQEPLGIAYSYMEDRISSAGDMYYHGCRLEDEESGFVFARKDYYAIDDEKKLHWVNREYVIVDQAQKELTIELVNLMNSFELREALFLVEESLYQEILRGERTETPKLPLPHPEEPETLGVFLPFDEVNGGIYYGVNALNKTLIVYDRTKAQNYNGLVLGYPGSCQKH